MFLCRIIVFFYLCELALASAPFPFNFNPGSFFGYELPPKSTGELECLTDSKHPGTCMQRKECNQLGGKAFGSCGSYGVCCEISMGCGKVSRAKKTYIKNPSPIPEHCAYYLRPYSKYVCQIRIDMNLRIGTPVIPEKNRQGSYVRCVNTYIQIGQYYLCGVNSNKHVYLPFNAERDPYLEFKLSVIHKEPQSSATDYWDLVVTQLECPPKRNDDDNKKEEFWDSTINEKGKKFDNDLIAPPGCSLYYTERTGFIYSFNYNEGHGPYLGNVHHAACFRRQPHDKSILFEGISFRLDSNAYEGKLETDLNCYDPSNPNTAGDYISLPDSILTTPNGNLPSITTTASKYCGSILEGRQILYSPPGPFVFTVHTDDKYISHYGNHEKGVKIRYTIL